MMQMPCIDCRELIAEESNVPFGKMIFVQIVNVPGGTQLWCLHGRERGSFTNDSLHLLTLEIFESLNRDPNTILVVGCDLTSPNDIGRTYEQRYDQAERMLYSALETLARSRELLAYLIQNSQQLKLVLSDGPRSFNDVTETAPQQFARIQGAILSTQLPLV